MGGGETRWIHAFPKVFVCSEIQSDLSKIWTWVTNSISYNDNCYAKPASDTWREDGHCQVSLITLRDTKKGELLSMALHQSNGLKKPSLKLLKPILQVSVDGCNLQVPWEGKIND